MGDPTTPPAVSVVIAVRNGADTVQRCIDSITRQESADVDLVVVDGASTDDTVEILRRNGDNIAWWTSEKDAGVYDAWNKALVHATGDWIIFMGADDTFASNSALKEMLPHLVAADGRSTVVYGKVDLVDDEGRFVRRVGVPWEEAEATFSRRMAIPHQGVFHHRSLFDRHGHFDTSFRIAGDYEFLLRELERSEPLFVPDVVVANMRVGGISDDPDSVVQSTTEFYRARLMHGLETAPEWRAPALIRARIHYRLSKLFGHAAAERVGYAYRLLARSGDGRSDGPQP